MLLEPYNNEWPEEFERLKRIYTDVLGTDIIKVEHIGSTAVPGLMAKPIIDIDIIILDYDMFAPARSGLESLGYRHNGDQGIFQREAFLRDDADVPRTDPRRQWIAHHLYVCPEFSEELKRHLSFRDILRSDMTIRNQYEQMKLKIAARAMEDRTRYADIKEKECKSFIHKVIHASGKQG